MIVHPWTTGRRHRPTRPPDYRRRFGLSADAVRPLFAVAPGRRPVVGLPRSPGSDPAPDALTVYEPGLSGRGRLLARLGTSRSVVLAPGARPVSMKALVFVGAGAIGGTLCAQPFDSVTFAAPLYGLIVGGTGGAVGWLAVRRRRATTIVVEDWRAQLDAVSHILRNADLIGQPFVSPRALRSALHCALWHAVNAVGQPGDHDVLGAFDEQLAALRQATEATLVELESQSIAARKAAVSERLAAAVSDIEQTSVFSADGPATGDGTS